MNVIHGEYDPNRHVSVLSDEMPEGEENELQQRPDIPVPSPYQPKAYVTHRKTKQRAVIWRVDWMTRQLRLWYPDRAHLDKKAQFDGRTEWRSFDDWEPEITASPEEIERQTALGEFARELEGLEAEALEMVSTFCEDPDPRKSLKKLQLFKKMQPTLFAVGSLDVPAEPAKKGK